MKIIFDPLPGELRDYLFMLDNIVNLERYIEKVEKDESGEKLDSEFKEFVMKVRSTCLLDKTKLDKYFKHYTKETTSLSSFLYEEKDFWKGKDINEYLYMLENKSEEDKKLCVLEFLHNNGGKEDKEEVLKELCKNNDEILKAIKDSGFNSSLKWDLFCFIQDMEKGFKEFIEFIRSAIPVYEDFKSTREKLIKKLKEDLDKNINNNEKALSFIKKSTRNILNYDTFQEIYVTVNYFQGYGISFSMENDVLYIFLGAYYEKALKMLGGEEEDRLQANLMVYKNLCDKNRFEILKLLTENNTYYQGEIAEILGITNATVSYHMSFLIGANLVTLDKQNKKAFYILNKKTLEESLNFIKEQFNL